MRRWIGGALAVIAISIATVLMFEGAASVALFVRDYATATTPKTIVRPHTEHDTLLGWVNRVSFSAPNEYGRGIGFNTTPERSRGRGALAPGKLPCGSVYEQSCWIWTQWLYHRASRVSVAIPNDPPRTDE